MRIKFGFISNSSSTSFIIIVNKDLEERCPYCGRTGSLILNIISGDYYNNRYDNTKVSDMTAEDVLEELYENLEENKEWLNNNKNESVYRTLKDMQTQRDLINKIKDSISNNKKVYELSIDYHDVAANEDLKALHKLGVIEILQSAPE